MIDLFHHLWQSTVFAFAVALLALALRKHRAQVRHWLWFAASIKFLLPFVLLWLLGTEVKWTPPPRVAASTAAATLESVTFPIPFEIHYELRAGPQPTDWFAVSLMAIWACGVLAVLAFRLRDWWSIRALLRASTPLDLNTPVPVRSAPGLLEPGVVGFWRPFLLLPAGIERHLTPEQLEAVLAHEIAHVRRRDNLLSSVQMLVETLFWFYPLVWWIGARLIEERERACDEAVLSLGGEPRTYAEAILNICKLYAASPLACLVGVCGADLRKRIEAIMTNPTLLSLRAPGKATLGTAAGCALLLPLALGLLRAQSPQTFEVASVRPLRGNSFRAQIDIRGTSVSASGPISHLLQLAYGVRGHQIVDAPESDQLYAITAKVEGNTAPTMEQARGMLRNLLAERFHLRVHTETRPVPVYALEIANGGPKIKRSPADLPFDFGYYEGVVSRIDANVSMQSFCYQLSAHVLDRPVVDRTGLEGLHRINLRWSPPGTPPELAAAGSIFTAVQEDLGLRLTARTEPTDVWVVDGIQPPTEN